MNELPIEHGRFPWQTVAVGYQRAYAVYSISNSYINPMSYPYWFWRKLGVHIYIYTYPYISSLPWNYYSIIPLHIPMILQIFHELLVMRLIFSPCVCHIFHLHVPFYLHDIQYINMYILYICIYIYIFIYIYICIYIYMYIYVYICIYIYIL